MEEKFGEIDIGTVFKLYPNSPNTMLFEKTSEKEAKHIDEGFGIELSEEFLVTTIAPS